MKISISIYREKWDSKSCTIWIKLLYEIIYKIVIAPCTCEDGIQQSASYLKGSIRDRMYRILQKIEGWIFWENHIVIR